MSIVNDCMVVNLQIGMWTGYRFDKDATRRALIAENAVEDAARVNKHLLSKDSLAKIVTATSALRNHFYTTTLPWKDNGDRLLTRKMYKRFIEEHSRLRDDFNNEVDNFLDYHYPRTRDTARVRLGEMFKETDYPEAGEVRRRYYVVLDIDAVTTVNDFRVTLDQDQLDNVRNEMEEAMRARLGRATRDLWDRVAKTATHFHERLAAKDGRLHDSALEKLQELVEVLPNLNVLNDPKLEEYGKNIEAIVRGLDTTTLRKDKEFRADVADEVKKIMDDMSGFMNAFGAK